MKYFTILFVIFTAMLVGAALHKELTTVDCPTEDSCTIDYRQGSWHVETDVP